MTHPDLPSSTGPTLENLTNRYGLIKLMVESHRRWMHRTNDPQLQEIHGSLANHLEAVLAEYRVLLEILQTRR